MGLTFKPARVGQKLPRDLIITMACDQPGCPREDCVQSKSFIKSRAAFTKKGWRESQQGKFSCPTCNGVTPRMI